jgi:PAS domain S-box-containing protein
MLGYNVNDLLGKAWTDYAFEEDVKIIAERYKKRLAGENISAQVELRMLNKEGNILNVISNSSIIHFENKSAVFGTIKDITEQKAKEAQLVKLFTAVQQSPSSVIITDPSGNIEYVNPIFELITGFNSEEIIGKKTNILRSGLMPQDIYHDLWSTIGSGKIWRGELLNTGKNKDLFWVSASIAPIKNTEGIITDYIAVEDDITFAKYARQEIERKEKLLTATLDNVPVIIFLLNNLGEIDFIKGNGLDLLGYSDEHILIGKPIVDLFGGDNESESGLEKVEMNKPVTILKFVKDLVFEVHYSYFNDSSFGNRGTIGLAVNITDYYNAEKTIKESEAKIRAILKAIPDYIIEVNIDKTIVSFHQPHEAAIQFPPDLFVGKSIKNALPNTFSKVEEFINAVFKTGESITSVYDSNLDGVERYYEARFVLKDEERILVMVREITDKIHAENELIKAKENAEKSDKLKSEFLAHMSHEIRSPVNTIMNYANLIEEELFERLSDELKDGFKVINDGGMRLIRTIDLILNMSQIQTNTYIPNYHYLDIDKQILSSIIPEFFYRAKKKGLELIYTINSENPLIYADDYTVGQIFANLIDNALKYTKNGKIEITVFNENNNLSVEVIDTGIGISDEYLPNLFAPFTQEEMGYTRRFDGTGLGLALVKKYVEINNAEILVESEKDKGAKFIVRFPLSTGAN